MRLAGFSTVMFLLGASVLQAQGVAKTHLAVIVMDITGAVVPQAGIEITRPSDIAEPIMEADEYGQLHVDAIPGDYSLIVSSPGFVTSKQQLEVHGTSQSYKVTLTVGGCTECVVVTSEPRKPEIPQPLVDAVPSTCSIQPFKYEPSGVPHFFPLRRDVRYGVSLPRTSYGASQSVIPLHIWIDNRSDKDIALRACSMFAGWDVDVWNGSQRIPSRREQRDGHRWPMSPSCGVDVLIIVKAHTCSVANQVNLHGQYDLTPSVLSVTERPRKAISPIPPSPSDSLRFEVLQEQ